MAAAKITVKSRSYAKILLHAAKYPHCKVDGLLIGKLTNNGRDALATDAIPLFHTSHGLTPMLEIALSQAEAYAESQKLSIVGYYQANEQLSESHTPDAFAIKIADRILSCCKYCSLMMVDNCKVSLSCQEDALVCYNNIEGKWKKDSQYSLEHPNETLPALAKLMTGKAYKNLKDFDNHLDDISVDWLNISINKQITEAM
ncbi:ER membrane protein complex subunit 8 [Trichoplax sp. H2]|uniref:MPN domain-containing protein n=1 Tax=Trichoplax adhaerens TaxID=10228 RepID=B3S6U6_TRIAD|nr:hypothetical protein TRIADDRAFT_29978 [Trichoplax adhaerens]EDV21683.1 hypothetical protein TRIADDRAFT_29978 [Trichoplax adhaerens]RDD40072.1 ER membrane protein complex subunit 8 [Trichoplax sp. H2]|eukprot:XP_002115831.1 hypothetical protein TRIADDRAFT_29978 [Trichoplax adhaerens]